MATGPYGGFDFEKTILAAKAGADERNIKIATQVVRNQQFEKEMTLRKSQLNERIRSNKAVEDYRDRGLLQADEHFEENLDQRQTEFSEKHDLDERTHEYFKEISDRRQELSEDQFSEEKRQFEVTTGYNYDRLSQDWDKHRTALEEDSRQFDEGLNENQRQFNKNYKQRRKEFKERHKLDEAQFKELRKMNKFKRTMSKAEFEEAKHQFETTTGYKYDVLSQDLLKFDESMTQDLYKYNRSQTFEETRFRKKHNLDIAQFSELRDMNEFKKTMTDAEFKEQIRQFEKSTGYKYDALSQDLMKFDMGMDQDLYKYNRSQSFQESQSIAEMNRNMVNPNYLPQGLPDEIEDPGTFFRSLLGGIGMGGGAILGSGVASVPFAAAGGAYGYGLGTAVDVAFSGTNSNEYKEGLNQIDTMIQDAETELPNYINQPKNLIMYDQQLQQALSLVQGLNKTKQNKKRIKSINKLLGVTGTNTLLNLKGN